MPIATAPEVCVPTLSPAAPMCEVRDALPGDEGQAWSLQRAAFDLAQPGPPPHPGTHQELRVLAREGQVLSCLTLIHAELCVRGERLPMGGIRHVATHPEHQNQGYASTLMRDTLRRMRERGLVTSVLFPFSFRYYRKFGYELGGNHCQFWCRPNCIPAYAERSDCRLAAARDIPGLDRFYRERGAGSACAMARDERRWSAIRSDAGRQVVVHGAGIDGYAVLDEARDSYGGKVARVLDMSASSPAAWRGLLGYLSQLPVESVEWFANAADLAASGLLHSRAPLREGFKPRGIATIRPMFQFRVVDVEGALRARLGSFPGGSYRLALRVRDDLLPENGHPVAVCGLGDRVEVRRARPSDPFLELDIRVFSQLVCGYMSPCEAVSQGLGTCSSPAALETAEQLFPAGEPFISELDRF